ncbi:pyrroloquinoline quinone biosynthesis peptide chaperone PqqD [Zavarzinia sp. CC-PAN008]|uniref:pyrroloquinoline quinone biosynthesis peptide chaperone PqqD n=1 Tax=Zavarzinia sp. CC-PAN008 TaxID=3243332 RepID=UPI003F74986E
MTDAADLTEDSIPRLPRFVKLRHDEARGSWVLLAPERVFMLDQIAAEILKTVDGQRTLGAVIDDLASRFQAPRELIARDVTALLRDLAEKQFLDF